MAISIRYWANYTNDSSKLATKSENAVQCNRILKFLYDNDSKFVIANVQASMKDKSYKVEVGIFRIEVVVID